MPHQKRTSSSSSSSSISSSCSPPNNDNDSNSDSDDSSTEDPFSFRVCKFGEKINNNKNKRKSKRSSNSAFYDSLSSDSESEKDDDNDDRGGEAAAAAGDDDGDDGNRSEGGSVGEATAMGATASPSLLPNTKANSSHETRRSQRQTHSSPTPSKQRPSKKQKRNPTRNNNHHKNNDDSDDSTVLDDGYQPEVVLLDSDSDSDSDNDNNGDNDGEVTAEVSLALQKAREAREALEKAQREEAIGLDTSNVDHGDEDEEDEEEDVVDLDVLSSARSTRSRTTTGASHPPPMEHSSIQRQSSIDLSSSPPPPPNNKDQTPRISILTRIKNGDPTKTHTYNLRINDPLSKILTAHRQRHSYSSFKVLFLERDGLRLSETNVEKTPADCGMTTPGLGVCVVEIVDEAERQKQVKRMPKGSSTVVDLDAGGNAANHNNNNSSSGNPVIAPGEIPIKLRLDGNPKSIVTLGLQPTQPFRILMEKFYVERQRRLQLAENNNNNNDGDNLVVRKECKFEFDGEVLDPEGTPENEDLEGGEMVDVTTAVKKVARRERIKPREVITVLTIRNNNTTQHPKKFKLYSTDTFAKLKEGYVGYYKKKGCRSVKFYFNNNFIEDIHKTFFESGVRNMDSIAAIENGKKFVAV